MIIKATESSIDSILEIIKNRKISSIKISKQDDKYYLEYEECFNNGSSKIIELLSIVEEFKEDLLNDTLSNFYLYYNVVIDQIIVNLNKTKFKEVEVDPIVNILEDLSLIKANIKRTALDKITLTNGKKRLTTTYSKVVDDMVKSIREELKGE